ncbi:MAG: oxidoreductase [Parcubacteria group bacterium CG10_big_fil_rev_8_21_14_0_10_36_14]|nr:MAG: oxidoreductase [Parcubacteria group bacterium CG10_big_fil_rev_8_21_14_0_10_36_14]
MEYPLKIAIIGAGYWGKNLIRNAASSASVSLVYVCDLDLRLLERARSNFPFIKTTCDSEDIFKAKDIEAVFIATPVVSHYKLAKRALESSKHVFVEKPMTETSAEARELIELAKKNNLLLHVDHTFIYTGAVRKIKELINADELGEIRYIDSERINLGLIQPDVNVIYDLAVHDLSIFNYILKEKPMSVAAFGKSYVTQNRENPVEEMAHIHLEYPSGTMAHIHIGWLSPVKIRKMLIGGSKKMVLYNDIEPTEKVKVYDHGADLDFKSETPSDVIYRSGDVYIPALERSEALAIEISHFADCAVNGKPSLTGGEEGYEVVRILEATQKILKRNR